MHLCAIVVVFAFKSIYSAYQNVVGYLYAAAGVKTRNHHDGFWRPYCFYYIFTSLILYVVLYVLNRLLI